MIQRTKNSFVDYRFVVEPDIKPFSVSEECIQSARSRVGELPEQKRQRLKAQFGLSDFDVETLTSSRELALWFEEAAAQSKEPKKVANWILAELLAVLKEQELTVSQLKIGPGHIAALVDVVQEGRITSKQAKEVFAEMLESAALPADIIKAKGMEQVSDTGAIEALVDQVIAENPKAVEDFKGGKTNVLGWLTGQVMKKSAGKANPATATALVKEKLSAL